MVRFQMIFSIAKVCFLDASLQTCPSVFPKFIFIAPQSATCGWYPCWFQQGAGWDFQPLLESDIRDPLEAKWEYHWISIIGLYQIIYCMYIYIYWILSIGLLDLYRGKIHSKPWCTPKKTWGFLRIFPRNSLTMLVPDLACLGLRNLEKIIPSWAVFFVGNFHLSNHSPKRKLTFSHPIFWYWTPPETIWNHGIHHSFSFLGFTDWDHRNGLLYSVHPRNPRMDDCTVDIQRPKKVQAAKTGGLTHLPDHG